MSGAANSHLWAVTGVAVKHAPGWIRSYSYHRWAGCAAAALKKRQKTRLLFLSVSFLDAPFSARPKSWLVVARGASARLQLVGHLGWVHQHEASPVGQPRERMKSHREALMPTEIALVWREIGRAEGGGSE